MLSLFYVLVTAGMSWVKLLWLDELITLHLARLGSVPALWRALRQGADPNPPLIHLSVMLCRHIFGEHAFALRMPAILGYWIGMLALFAFLKRRVPAKWALVGVVMSLSMGGFEWSHESRSYALFYGSTMTAFYFWSRSAESGASRRRSGYALAAMAAALALGLCANYFAVLAFFPVAIAELVQTFETASPEIAQRRVSRYWKAIRWSAWLSFALAASPLLLFRSMIANAIRLYAPYAWNKVSIGSIQPAYVDVVAEVLWAFAGITGFTVAVAVIGNLTPDAKLSIRPRWLVSLSNAQAEHSHRTLSLAEATGVSVLIAYPLFGYAMASARGGMFSSRFVLPVCFGFAIAGTLFAYRAFAASPKAAGVLATLFLLWFASREAYIGYEYEVQKESFYRVLQHIPEPDYPGQPLVLGDNLLVLPLRYYAPAAIASRIVYPIDFPATMQTRGEASGEMNFWAGRTAYDFPIIPFQTLQHDSSSYLILTSGRNWLVDDLRRNHYPVQRLPIDTEAVNLDFWATPVAHGKPELYRALGDRR